MDTLTLRGTLEGHGNWVTAIATTSEAPDMVLSASRDKTIIVWNLTRKIERDINIEMKSTTVSLASLLLVTLTSLKILPSLPMVNSPCPLLGITPCVSGT
ncbi:hypothetical protein G6F56_012738 [Rhizopus delemar]|nr:hypothetical protein G6F56_012738 [Rhizopus delemar]